MGPYQLISELESTSKPGLSYPIYGDIFRRLAGADNNYMNGEFLDAASELVRQQLQLEGMSADTVKIASIQNQNGLFYTDRKDGIDMVFDFWRDIGWSQQ